MRWGPKQKGVIRQPAEYVPNLEAIDNLAKEIPRAVLDGGVTIGLVALAYAVWSDYKDKARRRGGKYEIGLVCHHTEKPVKRGQGQGQRKQGNARCGAPIVSSTQEQLTPTTASVKFVCAKKHVTEVIVNHKP